MLLQQYNKARNLTGLEAPICRFLPVELAQILITYLCYIRPIQTTFQAASVLPTTRVEIEAAYQHWLFVKAGRRMNDDNIRLSFTTILAHSGLLLKFSAYRFASLLLVDSVEMFAHSSLFIFASQDTS